MDDSIPFWVFLITAWGSAAIMLGTGFLIGSMWAEHKIGQRVPRRRRRK